MKWTTGATVDSSVAAWTWTVDATFATGRWFAKVGRATCVVAGAFMAAMSGDRLLPEPLVHAIPVGGRNGR